MDAFPPKKQTLLDIARERFGELSENSIKLIEAAEKGVPADYEGLEDNVVDGEVLTWLCCDIQAHELVHRRGLLIFNARIRDELELSYASIPFGLRIHNSIINNKIRFYQTKLLLLSLSGSHTVDIDATKIEISSGLFLDDGFKANGEVRFHSAKIDGPFDCNNGTFINDNKIVIHAERIVINGTVALNNGFKSIGEVRFHSARIKGSCDCNDSEFSNQNGIAFNAELLEIDKDILFRNIVKMEGMLNLNGAKVGGNLECDNSKFHNEDKIAIHAGDMKINGNVYFRNNFSTVGFIYLFGAEINKYFILTDVNFNQKFKLDLRSCHVSVLWDSPRLWQDDISIYLDGFTYDRIYEKASKNAEERIDWLNRQPGDQYLPQPYEQLAKVLRQDGHEEEAKKILIEKARKRVKHLPKYKRPLYWVYGGLAGYGYRPFRAVLIAMALIVIGACTFDYAYKNDLMLKRDFTYITSQTNEETQPQFHALAYAIDVFTPLVDLHQEKHWQPDSSTNTGYGVLLLFWFEIAAGWLLTTFFVAGISGLVRI